MVPVVHPDGTPCQTFEQLCRMPPRESYSSGNVWYRYCARREDPAKTARNRVECLMEKRIVLVMYGTALHQDGKPCKKSEKWCRMPPRESYSSGNVWYKNCVQKENLVRMRECRHADYCSSHRVKSLKTSNA
jgi:hypothetical protein